MIDNTVQQLRKYRILGWIGLLLLTLMCVLVSLTLGARTLPISAIWHYIEMYYINMPAAHISYNDLVIDARIPRTLIGLLAGAALALSGAVTQGYCAIHLVTPDYWVSMPVHQRLSSVLRSSPHWQQYRIFGLPYSVQH